MLSRFLKVSFVLVISFASYLGSVENAEAQANRDAIQDVLEHGRKEQQAIREKYVRDIQNITDESRRQALANAPRYPIHHNPSFGVFFAKGSFFYFTCEKADELIRAKNLPTYPKLEGFQSLSMGDLISSREGLGYLNCVKLRLKASQRTDKYGTADDLMKRHLGK
ncbi:hypothetical protein ACW7G0_03815 [Lysobacter sp. A286]